MSHVLHKYKCNDIEVVMTLSIQSADTDIIGLRKRMLPDLCASTTKIMNGKTSTEYPSPQNMSLLNQYPRVKISPYFRLRVK